MYRQHRYFGTNYRLINQVYSRLSAEDVCLNPARCGPHSDQEIHGSSLADTELQSFNIFNSATLF